MKSIYRSLSLSLFKKPNSYKGLLQFILTQTIDKSLLLLTLFIYLSVCILLIKNHKKLNSYKYNWISYLSIICSYIILKTQSWNYIIHAGCLTFSTLYLKLHNFWHFKRIIFQTRIKQISSGCIFIEKGGGGLWYKKMCTVLNVRYLNSCIGFVNSAKIW